MARAAACAAQASLLEERGLLRAEADSPQSRDEAAPPSRGWRVAGVALALLGACTAAGALLALQPSPPSGSGETARVGQLSARQLLESPELHEVATENVMRLGRRSLAPADRERVRAAVAAGFLDLSGSITGPAAADLDRIRLDAKQKDALLRTMRLISEPRVQILGLTVAHAIRDSRRERPEIIRRVVLRQDVLRRLALRLEPRARELRGLRDELLPRPLRALRGGQELLWEQTFDPENLRVMATVDDAWEREIEEEAAPSSVLVRRLRGDALAEAPIRDLRHGITMAEAPVRDLRRGMMMAKPELAEEAVQYYDRADDMPAVREAPQPAATTPKPGSEEAWHLAEAVLEQGRAHLRLIHAVSALPSSTPLADAVEISKVVVDCHLSEDELSHGINSTKAILCPLRLGSQGLDMLLNC